MAADTRWHWEQFCGTNQTGFPVWQSGDFGHCFEKLVFVTVSNGLLAAVTAHQLGRHSERQVRGPIYFSPSLCLRTAVSLVLMLSGIISPLLIKYHLHLSVSWVDILTFSVTSFTWMIHSIYVWKLQRFYHLSLRGPPSVLLSVLLVSACTIIQLDSVLRDVVHHSRSINVILQYNVYITACMHLLYWATVIPTRRPPLELMTPRLHLQHTEVDSLLNASTESPSYGAVPPQVDVDLGVGEDRAGWLSRLTFWWVTPLMAKGSKTRLESCQDLFELPSKLDTQRIEQRLQSVLAQQAGLPDEIDPDHSDRLQQMPSVEIVGGASQHGRKSPSLLSALNKCFGCEYYPIGILKLLADLLGFAGPILLNLLVSYVEDTSEPVSHGYYYAAGLFASTLLGALLSAHFSYLVAMVGLKIRAAMITAVYRKALCVTSVSLNTFSTGQVVNFMSTDTDRVVNFCNSFHQFWSLPFQVAVSLYLLHQQLGLSFLAGLAFAILLIPVNRVIAIKIGQLSNQMMTHKDNRVKIMSEILQGLRVIKFYAWEAHFAERVKRVRAEELQSLKGRKYLDALCVYFWATTPVLISILTFTTYALLGNQLTAAKVFTSLALFNMLISPLNAFPWVINGLMEAWVSLQRLQAFLSLPDIDRKKYYAQRKDVNPGTAIEVYDGTFSWFLNESSKAQTDRQTDEGEDRLGNGDSPAFHETEAAANLPCLRNISFRVQKGIMVGVIGKVGSGKSSLLSALLGEMSRRSGDITVGKLAEGFGLAPQESWIQQGTIQENILFGRVMDRARYDKVLDACALLSDLQVMSAGDKTEIGENGVTLSGGQKARVALARAVYQDKPVYLLDDPLAAVDAHVAQHIFTKCIMGILCHRTRILCTHHTQYLQEADMVIEMKDGEIHNIGLPDTVLSGAGLETNYRKDDGSAAAASVQEQQVQPMGDANLVQDEEQESGTVRLSVYKSYWAAVGGCLAPTVLVAIFLMQASRNVNDWWLSYWVTHSHGSHHHGNSSLQSYVSHAHLHSIPHEFSSQIPGTSSLSSVPWSNITEADDNIKYYLTVYGILAGANSLFTLLRAFLFAYGGICAARVLHDKLLSSVLQAPVSFFDSTPIGRILNRFSSDLYSVDDSLPFILNIFLAQLYGLLGSLVVTCYGIPWFILMLPPLGVLYYFIENYYRKTSREIKRITSVTLSPIYAHFSESVTGLVTIRAFRHMPRFCSENRRRLDANQCAQFAGLAASQWLNIRLQMLGVAMVTGVAFIAVFEHHFHAVNPGLVGLAISYALSITNLMSGVVTSFTETEKQMVSVERVEQYVHDIPQEKQESILSVPPFWPIQGAVTFHRVCLRYRPGLPLALNNVTFETQPAEKLGIVGRTGSGKSSLFSVLFRLVDIEGGQLLIDGIGLRHLDLTELRSKLAIIPQDPFLFSGSVRENLDPRGAYRDPLLWSTLERCHLRQVVANMGGLEAAVGERGRMLSAGQRQLVCLARAMLIKAKVLCIDEATASVDQETDDLLQAAIREEFADHTVLTIAHRIRTVLDSDRVLVMDKGRVVEYAPPEVLLENKHSLFYSLINGKSPTDKLFE